MMGLVVSTVIMRVAVAVLPSGSRLVATIWLVPSTRSRVAVIRPSGFTEALAGTPLTATVTVDPGSVQATNG